MADSICRESEVIPFGMDCFLVFIMFIVSNTQSLFLAAYFDRIMIAGLRIRSGLTTMIYRKALCLKNSERKDTTVGEIVNLMSVDTQRVPGVNDVDQPDLVFSLSNHCRRFIAYT